MNSATDGAALEELRRLIARFDTGLLITFSLEGEIRARPMAIERQQNTPLSLLFVTDAGDAKVRETSEQPQAGVALQRGRLFVSLSGVLHRLQCSVDELRELWRPSWRLWFPRGPADPRLMPLRFECRHAEYWDRSGTQRWRFYWRAGKALLAGSRLDDAKLSGHAKIALRATSRGRERTA